MRRVFLFLAVMLIGLCALPAWRNIQFFSSMSRARTALEDKDFNSAIASLGQARRYAPDRPEVAYLLAVANRRLGHLEHVEPHLKAAEQLGWSSSDTNRQRLLVAAQLGRFHSVEPDLKRLLQSNLNDEAALEVYEALAHGYWANHQINDALQCLDYWIRWRPHDIEARLMRADAYIEFKDPLSAEKDYRAILESDPDHAVGHQLLGRALMQLGHVEKAADEFRHCLRLNHRNHLVLAGIGECELRAGHVDAAEQWMAQIDGSQLPPQENVTIVKVKADIARYRRQHQKAVDLLLPVVKEWPHDSSLHQTLAMSYSALGQRELANKHLELHRQISERAQRFNDLQRKLISFPDNADLRYEIAAVLTEQGLEDDAAGWCQSALRCEPSHLASHLFLADYHTKRGKDELAEQHREAITVAKAITFRRTWATLAIGDLVTAEVRLKSLRKCENSGDECRILSAAVLNKQKKFEEALALLDGQLVSDPLRPFALIICGESLNGLGRPLNAEVLWREAIELDPDSVDAHRFLAVVYYDLGASGLAEHHLRRVAELDPSDFRPHRLLGLMNRDHEAYDAAIEDYQESLRRNPNQPPREEVLRELALCLVKQREYQQALEVLAQATSSTEKSTLTAECYLTMNRRNEAVALLDQVLKDDPDDLSALTLRADAAMVDNQAEKAVELLTHAVEKHPFDYPTRHKFVQSLVRSGREAEARKQLVRAEELKVIRLRFAKLHDDAADAPLDASLRRELAEAAEQMGRPDLKQVWIRAAEAIERRTEPISLPTATEPVATMDQDGTNNRESASNQDAAKSQDGP